MKKIMNSSETFVDDSLKGLVKAYGEKIKFSEADDRAIIRADARTKDKVSIITGGGYGHMPTVMGYVGTGFVDGCAVGNVFTSPSGETIYNAATETETGKGVLLLFANYTGDCLNFEMAKELLEFDGIKTSYVKASDDIASANKANRNNRRGIAGIYFAYKVAGALAEQGADLDAVTAVAEKACDRISSIGFAYSPCRIPGRTAPVVQLEDDEMELGMGIHGEPGIERTKIRTSKEMAEDMAARLVEDQELKKDDEIALLVNSLGGTSKEELGLFYYDLAEEFEKRGIIIYRPILGEYATSMEMIGASVSVFKLDDQLKQLLDEPAQTPFITV